MTEYENALTMAYTKACSDMMFALRRDDQAASTLYIAAASAIQDAYPELIDEYVKSMGKGDLR